MENFLKVVLLNHPYTNLGHVTERQKDKSIFHNLHTTSSYDVSGTNDIRFKLSGQTSTCFFLVVMVSPTLRMDLQRGKTQLLIVSIRIRSAITSQRDQNACTIIRIT